MTTPQLKGGGFSLNRLVLAKTQPEPKNVTCHARVSVGGVPTRHTSEHFLVAVLGSDVPAFVAGA